MAFNIGSIAGPAVGLGMGIYNMFNRGAEDRRQIKQQQKLTDMQAEANREAATYSSQLQYDMWKKTNFSAQKAEMEKAGINPATMLGMSGGGGTTAGSASQAGVSGGSASGAAATEQNKLAMGMQLAQMSLMTAQAEKTKAETKNLEAGTAKTGVETESGKVDLQTKQITQAETIERIVAEAGKAQSEQAIAWRENQIGRETMQDQIRAIQERAISEILGNTETREDIKIKEAEAAIQKFEAEASKNGISTKAPWYIKLMSNLYDRIDGDIKVGGNSKDWKEGRIK